jgi:hypothetical protein
MRVGGPKRPLPLAILSLQICQKFDHFNKPLLQLIFGRKKNLLKLENFPHVKLRSNVTSTPANLYLDNFKSETLEDAPDYSVLHRPLIQLILNLNCFQVHLVVHLPRLFSHPSVPGTGEEKAI